MVQRRFLLLLGHLALIRLAIFAVGVHGSQEQELPNFNDLNSLDFSASSVARSNESKGVEVELPVEGVENQQGPELNKKSHGRVQARAAEMSNNLLAELPGIVENLLGEFWSSKSKNSRASSVASSNSTGPRAKSSPLTGEAANLMSVTNQLVKLARSQTGADLSSWLTPMASWAHEIPAEFTAMSGKSEWFWMIVPAVIVLGAGVILIPMAAAWLVSHAMSQSAFSVTAAGKRRRKRDLLGSFQPDAPYMDQIYKMLDLHTIINDPSVLVDKLSRLHSALDSAQAFMLSSGKGKPSTKKQ